ncbi:hypothetical protein SETIT_3G380100v2 [Setaria italica]|uniref:Uncharacterized protein n=1 Tax=Setaria italica TaxID=4555 RepID=A0A368QQ54_SETIT|nr:hypothetical protein SETIT_3G380100v2 [Setaria italica]
MITRSRHIVLQLRATAPQGAEIRMLQDCNDEPQVSQTGHCIVCSGCGWNSSDWLMRMAVV